MVMLNAMNDMYLLLFHVALIRRYGAQTIPVLFFISLKVPCGVFLLTEFLFTFSVTHWKELCASLMSNRCAERASQVAFLQAFNYESYITK